MTTTVSATDARELSMATPDDRRAAYVVGTFDTKGEELEFIGARIRDQGVAVVTVDVSTSGAAPRGCDVSNAEVAAAHPGGAPAVFSGERGSAVEAMAQALVAFLLSRAPSIGGVIGAGGSGAAALLSPALQALPVGCPKLLVCTLASGDVRAFVGSADIMMLYPVVDVSGLNRISRQVLANAGHAIAGMVRAWQPAPTDALPAIGLTMFGVTTPCVQAVAALLEADHDCIVFHATGTGGQSMEKLVASGLLTGVLDLTTTEIADELIGGVLSAGPQRLDVFATSGIPYVGSVGALDMVNFWALDTVPPRFASRRLHSHNAQVTLMRTTPEENARLGAWIAAKLNRVAGPVRFLLPLGGVSALDAPGQPFWDPQADAALFDALRRDMRQTDSRRLIDVHTHINDPTFAAEAVRQLLEIAP
jgi:uncharacterized protein (UPF0261 family)